MSLTTTIGPSVITSPQEQSLSIDDANNERSIAQITAQDPTGTQHFQKGQQISVVDSTLGTLFAGNVNDSLETNLVPNAQINSQVNAIDYTYLADKRTYVDDDSRNAGQFAGTIATDLLQRYLAIEGVVNQYAMRRDTFFADFAQGILANTIPANNVGDGNLELSPAGAAVSVTEKTNAAFGAGTLNNTSAVNNVLQPTLASALMVQAYLPVNLSGADGYTYFKIWSGSMAIAANDTFHYEMWVPSTNPDAVISGVDFVCTDGTILTTPFDQLNYAAVVPNDLTPSAVNNWFGRDISIPTLSGKTISTIRVALYGTKVGLYTLYVKNIFLQSQSGTPFFSKTATATQVNPPQQLQRAYFQDAVVLIRQVPDKIAKPPLQGAAPSVYRVSPAQSIDAAKLIKSSFISWIQTTPGGTLVNVAISYDGGSSYIPCTNNAPLPGLGGVPGANIAGLSVQIREEFYTTDNDPTQLPTISYLSWNIQPSYAATKSDVSSSYITGGSWASGGTLSNLANTSGNLLTLNSILRNWNFAESSGQTIFGAGSVSPNTQIFQNLQYYLGCVATSEERARFDFAGTWADFTLEFDVLIDTAGVKYGCVYRCTGWQNNDSTWAYAVELSSVDLKLNRGTNSSSGAGSSTNVATTTFSSALSLNNWYRVKLVISGSSHKIYVNDTLYINATDGTYTAAGNVGLRNRNTTAGTYFAIYDNFGITASLAGTWTSNNISLTAAGSYLNSIITWADASSDYSQEVELVEASINGGSTYQTCTNGQPIPNFTPAQSLSGVNLILRVTLTGTSATSMPGLNNLTIVVLGAFSATGTRISPVLNLAPTGRAGSTLVNWNALTPTGTSILVETSPNGVSSWTAQSNGSSIFGINGQPDPTLDSFDTDTSANYTQSNFGSNGTWTWDTANSRITGTGGANATLVYNAISSKDGYAEIDMDQADDAGAILDYIDGNNLYFIRVFDASAVAAQNVIRLFKRVGGVGTQQASSAISFVRGTPHRIRLDVQAGVVTVKFDGVQVISWTDGSPLAAGKFGLLENSATGGRFYNIRMQPYGDLLAGKLIYSRVTLTSTDPTLTPQLQDLIVVAHDPNIANGTLIPKTAWQFQQQISSCLDDLAKQCNPLFWWAFSPDINNPYKKSLKFLPFGSTPAPWILTGNDIQTNTAPTVRNIADLYGNRFYGPNATDVVAKSKSFTGDGTSTSFDLDFPVDSITGITFKTANVGAISSKTFGVRNVDTGKDWYYQVGSTLITQDAGAVALNQLQTVTVSYNGQVPYTATAEDKAEQTNYQLLETGATFVMRPFGQSTLVFNPNNSGWNSSGIVERSIDCTGLNKAAADTLTAQALARYKVRGRTLSFKTLRPGLATGQVLTVFFSQFGIMDKAFLINHVILSFATKADGTQLITYQVECSETPFIGSFIKLFQA